MAIGLRGPAYRKPVLAQTPPMGWNSYDCFGAGVREWAVKENADYMAAHLLNSGYEYIVVDYQWYNPTAGTAAYRDTVALDMDMWGRLLPSSNRFPSAGKDHGFKPLADYVHRYGMRFGIHIMRGIPRQAVQANVPILGGKVHASEIADTNDTCEWNACMYGVNPDKPDAQAYYDSIVRLYADWGVDFIKADDMVHPLHAGEIRLLRAAIDRFAPNIVLSLAPGPASKADGRVLATNAEMWRVSADVWDKWDDIANAFEYATVWAGRGGPGHWPDLDMLPIGRLEMPSERIGRGGRHSKLTRGEQTAMMTLWCIFRSPLMIGGHLPDNDAFANSLLTNPDVLRVHHDTVNNRLLSRAGDTAIWAADHPDGSRYVAVFNLSRAGTDALVPLTELNIALPCNLYDCWTQQRLPDPYGTAKIPVDAHGARLLRLTPKI